MNKAISWQTSQIYNTLSSVHWRDRRDKIAYSCKDTFCLGSQPFKATSCGKQALHQAAVTVTLPAGGQLRKQSLSSSNEVRSVARKHRGVKQGSGFAAGVTMWRVLWSRRQATWCFVYLENLKETVSKGRGRFCKGMCPPRVLLVPGGSTIACGFRTWTVAKVRFGHREFQEPLYWYKRVAIKRKQK